MIAFENQGLPSFSIRLFPRPRRGHFAKITIVFFCRTPDAIN